jgi:hypothetical protein
VRGFTGHAATNCVRDQMPRPTAPSFREPVCQSPSPHRSKVSPPEGLAHDYYLRRRRTKRTYRASAKTPQKSKPDASGEGAPKLPETTSSQQYRMPDERTTTETERDDGSAPEKVCFPLLQIENQWLTTVGLANHVHGGRAGAKSSARLGASKWTSCLCVLSCPSAATWWRYDPPSQPSSAD